MAVSRLIATLSLLVLMGLLCACAPEPQRPLRIGSNIWPGYSPLYLARQLKHLDPNQVELFDFANTNELLRAMAVGSIDGGGVTLEELLHARDLGIDLVVILVADISNGADTLIAREPVKDAKQLIGKRIGIEPSVLGSLMAVRFADYAESKRSDFEFVPLALHAQVEAYKRAEVDAMITFEPVRSTLLREGGTEVFTSADIPGEIVDLIVVTREAWNDKRDYVEHLQTAWFSALAFYNSNREQALAIMDRRIRLGRDALQQAMQGLDLPDRQHMRDLLEHDGTRLKPTLNKIQALMLEEGHLSSPLELDRFFVDTLSEAGRTP